MKIIKHPNTLANCPRCECIFKFDASDIYTATGGSRRGVPIRPHTAVKCPCCGKSIEVWGENKSLQKEEVNPYPKYSFNSGLADYSGKPVWGTDIRWSLWEIKHGRIPKE